MKRKDRPYLDFTQLLDLPWDEEEQRMPMTAYKKRGLRCGCIILVIMFLIMVLLGVAIRFI